jgi:AraC family transcriptional regulator, transcriptional activator of pobA
MKLRTKERKNKRTEIPQYNLDKFTPLHRHKNSSSLFGYNSIEQLKKIDGFEIYSSEGLISSMGPLKSEFYRISLTVTGTLDMQIGLENYRHQPSSICFTYPGQIFSKNNISLDIFGYYLLFTADFLDDIIPSIKMAGEFPFYDISGIPFFHLSDNELKSISELVIKIDYELKQHQTGRVKAIKMYLYLILLESKRSYERQQLHINPTFSGIQSLVSRFRKLVSLHYLSKRQVADYAEMLLVSPNHLNRVVKEITGKTASDSIKEMLLQEAKSLLKYTDSSISEIAYQLNFSDPASFNRFFKSTAKETPANYRTAHK